MLRVVAGHVIALSPESFDECIARPSLECQRTRFDALHQRRTRDERFIGLADFVVGRLDAAIEDGARLPFVFTAFVFISSAVSRVGGEEAQLPQLDQGICFLFSKKAVNVYD